MTDPRRRPSTARTLFMLYAVALVALAVWHSLHEWSDPLDSSAAVPALAFALAAPAAVVPLVASGVGATVNAPVFDALVIVVALAEVFLLHRVVRGRRSKGTAGGRSRR
ncbi:hypothetical protein PUR71_22180 [Streptomyces sp. SP17BM10]|uniref:hypothetical protein n=1 Tax=Streptomyces sp. SP17BM10 TaxID=3002530 RepID=UPI002E7A3B00|nr:hypothetical protein [Streptomyces sp. SP17BM10]MEE1785590.1 hypothetical protein [Streptomyces sp. SP17BM10]